MNRLLVPFLFAAVSVQMAHATGDWASAPKGLDHYVDRLPAKSLSQLLIESAAKDGSGTQEGSYRFTSDDIEWQIKNLVDFGPEATREGKLAECEQILAYLRSDPASSFAWVNLVLDLRDCLADAKTSLAEMSEYCRWRAEVGAMGGPLSEGQIAEVQSRIAATKGRTGACYRYLLGASAFLADSYGEEDDYGQKEFEAVVAGFPDHPRAETALFMVARARMRHLQTGWSDEPLAPEVIAAAETAFQTYLDRYPEGRFVGDVYGWMGGVEVKREAFADSLGWYLKQLDVPGHPENTRSAARMIERVMAILLARPDEAPLQEIAARPEVAMGTVYWILDAPEANMYNGFYDHPEVVKRWRSHWLPRLAEAIRKNEAVWRDHDALPWFISIQAHAASNAGDQAGALALIRKEPALLTRSDDLAFLLPVVLQRSGDAAGAITAYRDFAKNFPKSPFRPGSAYRLATAYQDAGRSDDAVATLLQLKGSFGNEEESLNYFEASFYPSNYRELPAAASALNPDLTLAEPTQVKQYLDTLLQFSPVEELAGLEELQSAIDPAEWEDVRTVIFGRALSEGFPDIAVRFAGGTNTDSVRRIAELAAATVSSPTAEAYLKLGDAWKEARGSITTPTMQLNRSEVYVERESDRPELQRLENAAAAGLKDIKAEAMLQRDELWNAVQAWEKAAAAAPRGSEIEAKALLSILEGLPRIAMATAFARGHAARNQWTEWASERYRQLLDDCPGSPEALAAARPTFRLQTENAEVVAQENPAKADPFAQVDPGWTETLQEYSQNYIRHREFLYDSLIETEEGGNGFSQGEPGYQEILDSLYALDGGASIETLRTTLEAARRNSRKIYGHWNDACVHYAVEDLADLVAEANPAPPEVRTRYFDLRLKVINVMAWHNWLTLRPVEANSSETGGAVVDGVVLSLVQEAIDDPSMKSVRDRLECLRLFILANRQFDLRIENLPASGTNGETVIETRDYATVEEESKRFLETYPKSSKREAVWLLHLRASYRARRPLLYSSDPPFPENPFIAGLYIRKSHPNLLPWDAAPVEAAIEAYLKEFPNPTYAGEVHDLRAALAVRRKDWAAAISHTLEILQNEKYVDLQSDSRMRLCNVFARIAELEDRATVVSAIKTNPGVIPLLQQYLEATETSTWGMHPLQFLTDWTREQAGLDPVAAVAR
jgi:tetratricopeptide (TPR) repeat protein